MDEAPELESTLVGSERQGARVVNCDNRFEDTDQDQMEDENGCSLGSVKAVDDKPNDGFDLYMEKLEVGHDGDGMGMDDDLLVVVDVAPYQAVGMLEARSMVVETYVGASREAALLNMKSSLEMLES